MRRRYPKEVLSKTTLIWTADSLKIHPFLRSERWYCQNAPLLGCSQIWLFFGFHNLTKRSLRKKTRIKKLWIFCKAAIPCQCHSFLSFLRTQIAPPTHITMQISLYNRSLGFLSPSLVDAKLSQVVRGTAFSHLFPKKSDRCQLLPTPRSGSMASPSQASGPAHEIILLRTATEMVCKV